MKKIGIFWGSSSGNTEIAVDFMVDYLEAKGFEVDNFDVGTIEPEKMLEYDNLIIGCPTWNIGELQDDWDSIYLKFRDFNFEGKTAGFFGCGDQVGYPDNFLDAIGILSRAFMDKGGSVIGKCSRDEYDFRDSVALENDELLGLGLDYDNEDDKCEEQMTTWLENIIKDFD